MNIISSNGNDIEGSIAYYEGVVDDLKLLHDKNLCSGMYKLVYENSEREFSVEETVNDSLLQECKSVNIEISAKSKQGSSEGFICQSWADVLKFRNHLINPIKNIYIAECKDIVGESNRTVEYGNYTKISDVLNLLEKIAYSQTQNQYLIVCGQALEIEISVNTNALDRQIDTQVIDKLFEHDLHHEAMLSLMRECLFEQLSTINHKDRLSHLLRHFDIFATKVLVGYEQFVRNYSFDKVRREYQEKTTEYISKINSSFDDVAAKAFSIPAGVWLAAMQISESQIGSFQFLKNSVYLGMVFILVFIVCFIFFGQFSFINALKREYSELFNRLKSDLDEKQGEYVKNLQSSLDIRYRRVFCKLLITIISAIFLFVLTLGLVIHAIK
ncbi:hypothetical protein [Vibrio rumoiensis]|uniref:hypothetical protein n=1 Tax=Vibrio rumoiensis TaxID=76258 RepID=UPI003AA82786